MSTQPTTQYIRGELFHGNTLPREVTTRGDRLVLPFDTISKECIIEQMARAAYAGTQLHIFGRLVDHWDALDREGQEAYRAEVTAALDSIAPTP